MSVNTVESVAYASIPPQNDLCCIVCEIDFIEVHDSSAKSNFHWQVMKCRLLIHIVPEVIAAPVLGTERDIYVITTNEFYNTERMQNVIKHLNVLPGAPRPVTADMYKVCINYTIQYKIAPEWNKVGQYLVHGSNFLSSKENLRAVKLNIILNDRNAEMRIQAADIRLTFIQLEHFYVPPALIAAFLASPNGYIDLTLYSNQWVHILPSMKRGRVLSVSKKIAPDCPFKDYERLRRHWKNMYGYRLPKNPNGILYYRVTFPIPHSNVYTYPDTCILAGPAQPLYCKDAEFTNEQFLCSIEKMMPTICGRNFLISKYNDQQYLSAPSCSKFQKTPQRLSLKRLSDDTEPKLEFSANCANLLKFDSDRFNNSIRSENTCFTKIQQIRNFHLQTNVNNKKDTIIGEEPENSKNPMQALQSNITENETKTVKTIPRDQTISHYFKVQKPTNVTGNKNIVQNEAAGSISKKLKLLGAKSTSTDTASKMGCNDKVKLMAKNNKLGDLTCAQLHSWLNEHSVPYKKKMKKSDLIDKVLSEIKRT